MLFLLASCGDPPPHYVPPQGTEPVAQERGLTPLEDARLLRRMSLDLTGRLPTLDELDRVAADPGELDVLRDEMLDGPYFEERFRHVLAEIWLTRVDVFNIGPAELGLPDSARHEVVWSVGSEPLVLMARVAAEDRPWTDIVQADHTYANETLLDIYPLEPVANAPSEDEPWVEARYTDGRPEAGVIATNGMWWRYFSAPNNYNRSRGAALAKYLLCEDFLVRPVAFDAEGLADLDPELEAVKVVPSCRSCHATLDPLSAGFFGWWVYDLYDPIEAVAYHPERELLGEAYLETEMSWFGTPVDSPAELLAHVAYDPRFQRCAVEQTAQAFWRRELGAEDFDQLIQLEEDFAADGLRMKTLLRGLTDSPDYRVGHVAADAPEIDRGHATHRIATPELLANAVEQVTGLRWDLEGMDPFRDDVEGYRILAGGIDGRNVTTPLSSPSLSQAVVLRRLGQSAGQHMVESGRLDGTLTPDDAAFDAQLTDLVRQLHATPPSDEDLDGLTALWLAVADEADAEQAWASVVSVLIRDPLFWSY